MKEFRLSTPGERVASVFFVIVMTICFGALLVALRERTGLLIACGLGVALIVVLLAFSAISIMKAACIVEPGKKIVQVKGFPDYTVDVSDAVLMQTLPKKNGQSTARVIVFSDAEGKAVATIPTMFTHKQGMMAEPMAEELAGVLGIEFKRNIPEWEFDKKLYQEHMKEVEAQQRKENKERRQKRMEMRIRKRQQEK